MPSHFQFTPVFSQLQFMTSEVLCGGKFKHRFHCYSRESFNHLKYFNEVSSVASFLQTPESQTFKSFTVWQLGEAQNHPCATRYLLCDNQVTTLVCSIQYVGVPMNCTTSNALLHYVVKYSSQKVATVCWGKNFENWSVWQSYRHVFNVSFLTDDVDSRSVCVTTVIFYHCSFGFFSTFVIQ